MTYQDYEAKLTAIVNNPDTAPTAVQEILKELKSDTDSYAAATAGIEERDKRIRDLQETNIKLFTEQTGAADEEDEPEELTPDEELAALIKKIKED